MSWTNLEKRRVSDRKWREKNREKIRLYQKIYLKNHPGKYRGRYKKAIAESVRRWRKKHPERVIAHRKVFVEVRAGRMKRFPCFCGNEKSEAHHEDYSKPLEVIWLCRIHHRLADRERKEK